MKKERKERKAAEGEKGGKGRGGREEREEGSGRADRLLLLPPHPNFNQDPKYASGMDACEPTPGPILPGVTMHVIYFYCHQFFFYPSISSH